MSRLLVDTSVWVEHFSGRKPEYAGYLASDRVHIHELVIGELILGTLPRGDPLVEDLHDTPRLLTRPHSEVDALVQEFRLEGSGLNWPDVHILASARAEGADLWTLDRALVRAATRLGVVA